MIDESKYKQYGEYGIDIKGITIHNTSNYEMSAREIFNWINEECRTSQGCHYFVDEKEIIEVMPLDYHVWHTGNGYDFGNMNTIAIEICSIRDKSKYLIAEQKGIELVKSLMDTYGLTRKDIYFHNDFLANYNCPSNILSIYKNKRNFLDYYNIIQPIEDELIEAIEIIEPEETEDNDIAVSSLND